MSVDPESVDRLARSAVAVAQDAEQALVRRVAAALAKGIDAPGWETAKMADLVRQRAAWERIVSAYVSGGRNAIGQAILESGAKGQSLALASLRAALGATVPDGLASSRSVLALAAESAGIVDATRFGVLRAAEDLYRGTVAEMIGRVLTGGQTRRAVAQSVLDRLLGSGLTGFVDKAGRRWELASYVEMATRTAAQRAMTQAHTEALQSQGVDLIIVSDAPQECAACRRWEGKVLSLSGGGAGTVQAYSVTDPDRLVSVTVAGSLEQAKRAGLYHPGAVLGAAAAGVLGDLENACRAWYVGPSVDLRTARGHRLTVSPNHPVLTTRGWLRADLVRHGDQVLSNGAVPGVARRPLPDAHLDDVPATFEQVLNALRATGVSARITAARDDFHGDGRFYKGKVDVVWADGELLDAARGADLFDEREQFELMGPDAGPAPEAQSGPTCPLGDARGAHVGRTLPDGDRILLEPTTQRRLADAEDWRKVLAGLACGVSVDEVVDIHHGSFEGHAYDLQTSTGAYLANGILLHNCRHSHGAYLPGLTKRPTNTADPQGDADRRRLRELERRVRREKLREAAALGPVEQARAHGRVKQGQSAIREHVDRTGMIRQSGREVIGKAR